jgi:tyrosine-protein kinase Etk/Wzc
MVGPDSTDYHASLHQAQTDLAAAQANLQVLRAQEQQAQGVQTVQATVINPAYTSLKEQETTEELALLDLQARYTSVHPAVEEMSQRLADLRAQLARTSSTREETVPTDPNRQASLNAERHGAEQTVAQLSARLSVLQAIVSASDAQRSGLLDKEGVLEQLQDQIALKRSAYQDLLSQLEAKELAAAAERGRSSMVDSALRATASSPTLVRSLVFSLALGLFLGFALALLLETLDDTVRRPEDLPRDVDIRFLGVVPWTGDPGTGLVVLNAPKSPPAEAFRTLRSNINFATVDDRPHTLLVTSAGANEGKSMVAANLAVAYAQSGERVLLLDTDLRRPTQGHLFGLEGTAGLTNLLVGEMTPEQAIQPSGVERLSILPSGPLPPNPAELLDSARMTALLQELRQYADLIILDSPPAIMLSDALILASQVDKTLLVSAAGQVTRDAFAEMVRLLRHARGNLLGVVLNKLRLTQGDYYYYYYYYYFDHDKRHPGPTARLGRRPGPGPRGDSPLPPPPAADELPF